MPLEWAGTSGTKKSEVLESVKSQVEEKLHSAYEEFDRSEVDLDKEFRSSLLGHFDEQWSDHLETMSYVKQGVQWVTTVGENPEDAYKKRGFDTFVDTLDNIERQTVEKEVPQIVIGASILKRERELKNQAS